MTLSFSQTWPKSMGELASQPNYFIQKIWMNLPEHHKVKSVYDIFYEKHVYSLNKPWDIPNARIEPKLHTIREDKSNRWKAGMDIHFVINNRTKDRFQFAPVIKCVSVQDIEILYCNEISKYYSYTDVWAGGSTKIKVYVDGKMLDSEQLRELTINDGFESVYQFFQFFNTDFKGKIIHWTDLKY